MKKDIELSIELYKDGTVMMETSSIGKQSHKVGTVEFTATLDGRRRTFDPLETMEKAGLVTTKHDESMFPEYKATEMLFKTFKETGVELSYTDSTRTMERLNKLVQQSGLDKKQVRENLEGHNVRTTADAYQLSDNELKEFILK